MKSIVAVLVFVAFVALSVGLVVAQVSLSAPRGTDVAYAAPAGLSSSDEVAEPWIAMASVTPEVAQAREELDKFSRNFELRDVD